VRPFCPNWEVAEGRIRYPLTNRQLVADTVCMPPLLVASLTLLSSDLERATSRLTVGGWRRGDAPLLYRAIRRRAFREYGATKLAPRAAAMSWLSHRQRRRSSSLQLGSRH
jgi:hypothetical protein